MVKSFDRSSGLYLWQVLTFRWRNTWMLSLQPGWLTDRIGSHFTVNPSVCRCSTAEARQTGFIKGTNSTQLRTQLVSSHSAACDVDTARVKHHYGISCECDRKVAGFFETQCMQWFNYITTEYYSQFKSAIKYTMSQATVSNDRTLYQYIRHCWDNRTATTNDWPDVKLTIVPQTHRHDSEWWDYDSCQTTTNHDAETSTSPDTDTRSTWHVTTHDEHWVLQ